MATQDSSARNADQSFNSRLQPDFISGSSLTRTGRMEDVWITDELHRRVPRERDTEKERASLQSVGTKLQTSPAEMLTALMEQALCWCPAHTSGLSLLHDDDKEEFFHWDAMAGVLADKVGGTTPRKFSPCGFTLDRNSTQLVYKPGRYYHYFLAVDPQIIEALVVPVYVDRVGIGTIWIAAHDEQTHFTLTDVRIMDSLASFTSAAICLMSQGQRKSMARA
jgi:hypothetical protein